MHPISSARDVLQDYFAAVNEPCTNCSDYAVYSAAYVTDERRREFELVAEWSRDEFTLHAPVFANEQLGFNMRHFRVATNVVRTCTCTLYP